jgi:hypothetical protein
MKTGECLTRWLHSGASQGILWFWIVTFPFRSLQAEVPEMHWQHVYPYPTGNWLNAAAWGAPGFVVVGSEREILFSESGLQWQKITNSAPTGSWLFDVCFYNGKYVVVGQAGTLLWSTNGQNWQQASAGTNTWLRACAGGAGHYVISAGNSTLLLSTNAEDWQLRQSPADFVDIVYASNRWVAVTGGSTIYTSTDLQNWTSTNVHPFGGPVLNTVCFGQGRFMASGAWESDHPNGSQFSSVILTSTNGVTWDWASLSGLDAFGEIKSSVFAAGQFVAVQAGGILRSTNGESWEKFTGFDAGGALRGVVGSTAGRFLAVGAVGTMLRSDDAQNWHVVSADPSDDIQDMAYAAGHFVAVGGSPYYIGGPAGSAVVLTSTNGNDWQASLTNLENQLSAVAYGNGLWIVCGDDGGIFTSGDAMSWTNNSLPPTTHDLRELVFGNGRFIAFAAFRDLVYHSTNGVNWVSNQTALVSQIACARFVNGRFMGVGSNGAILSSEDGLNWQAADAPTTEALNTLAFGKGRYVVGGYFVTGYSMDGTNWTMQPAPMQVYDIQFMDGWFVAVGNNYGLLVSRDGARWESLADPNFNSFALNALAHGNGVVVAGGYLSLYRSKLSDSEAFRQRLRLLSPAQLEFYGASGYEYRIEESTNLTSWTPLAGWISETNQYLLWEAGSLQNAAKFWRAVGRPKP